MNEIIESIKARKSVRVFTDKEIEMEKKHTILDAALQAPTAGNMAMYSIINVTDQELLEKLALSCDNQPFIAKAKFVLIFCADYQKWIDTFSINEEKPRIPGPGELFLAMNDALIAAQNSVVAAESFGIGSCYIGDIMEKEEYHTELLGLPRYTFPVTMLVFGYPTEQQENRKKPARYDQKYIVHENIYHHMQADELREMFETQAAQNVEVSYDFDKWAHAFYNRKYNSDFSREMSRSVAKYIDRFTGE